MSILIYPLRIVIFTLILLFPFLLVAQQNATGNLSVEPTDKLEATAKPTQNVRAKQFQRALEWYSREDYPMCRKVIDSLVYDPAGELIIDSLSGLAYHMAGMSYYQLYDDVNAVPNYLRAIEIRDRCYPDIHNDQAHTRYNLANSMHWMGRPDTATYLLREAIDLYDRLERKDSTNWLRSLKLLGVIALEGNDPELVENVTVAMVNLIEKMSNPTLLDQYQVHYDAAQNYKHLKAYDASIREAVIATAAGYALKEVMSDQEAVSMAADAVNIIAGNYHYKGDMAKATAYYQRSIQLLDSIGGDPTSLNIAYSNLAKVAYRQQDYSLALRHIEKAESYPFNPDYPHAKANMYSNHGQILHKLGRNDKAWDYFHKAMVSLAGQDGVTYEGEYPVMNIDSISNLVEAVTIYATRAEVLEGMALPEEALADLRRVFQVQDQQRERVDSDGSRYLLSAEVRTFYNQAIDLLYRLHRDKGEEKYLWEAFLLSEEAKAYSQLAALRRDQALKDRREYDLKRSVAVLEREITQQPDKEAELAAAKLRLSLILRSTPGHELEKIDKLDREKITAFLKQEELELLEFHLNIPKQEASDIAGSYVFHVRSNGALSMIKLAVPYDLNDKVIAWRASIEQSAYRQKSLRNDQADLDAMYFSQGSDLRNILFPGLVAGDMRLGNRLCLIPDGVLNYVPFAALPLSAAGKTIDYATLPYLQTGRSLQLAYSASYLMKLMERESPVFTKNLLAFAPSFNGEATPAEVNRLRTLRSTTTSLENKRTFPGLAPLLYNRSEVEAITSLVPQSEVYYDEAATKQAFLQAVGGSRILHLSSHGMANPDNANLSFIAFAQAGKELEEKELLYFNDLSTLPMEADLVVLSACETSIGQVLPGESVLSLGSAFAAAGAKSTLTSLWKVDDAATEDLMINFYQELAEGETRAEALALAQQRQRAGGKFAHPYYWSAMTLNGAAGAIELKPAINWYVWLGGGLLLLGGGWGGWRKWRAA